MKLNKKTRYTVEILIYLASNDNVQVPSAAEELNIPISNFRKIVTMLQKKNYVESSRGQGGGIKLVVDPKDIDFYEIFLETESIDTSNMCLTSCSGCVNNEFCKFGYTITSRYTNFIDSFKGLTLEDLLKNK